ncbi:hypothetical protein FOZ63_013889, partial [Perkinsus olseni]
YRATANSVVERFHGTLRRRLMFVSSSLDLRSRIEKAISVYNIVPNATTRQSPIDRLLGREVRCGPGVPAKEITATNDRLVSYRGSEEDQESVYESSSSVISDLTLSEDFGSVANEQEIPQEDVHLEVEDDDNEQVLDLRLPEDFGYQQVEEAAQPEIPSPRP